MGVPEFPKFIFVLFIFSLLFSLIIFHCYVSGSLTCSSASFSLLFIPLSMFLILFLNPFISLLFLICVNGLTDVLYSFLKSSEYSYDHYFKFSIRHVLVSFSLRSPNTALSYYFIWDKFLFLFCLCLSVFGKLATPSSEDNGFRKRGSLVLCCVVPLGPQGLVCAGVSSVCVLCAMLLCPDFSVL